MSLRRFYNIAVLVFLVVNLNGTYHIDLRIKCIISKALEITPGTLQAIGLAIIFKCSSDLGI